MIRQKNILSIIPDITPREEFLSVAPKGAHRAKIMANLITKSFNTLKAREAIVLAMRYGAGASLREIGDVLGVTHERVRQIQVASLRKMRHPSRFLPLATELLVMFEPDEVVWLRPSKLKKFSWSSH